MTTQPSDEDILIQAARTERGQHRSGASMGASLGVAVALAVVGGVLVFVPPGAESKDEPATGRLVEQRGGLREDGRVAERVREHRVADPLARHCWAEFGGGGAGCNR